MARCPTLKPHFRINGIPATPYDFEEEESKEIADRFAKMRLSKTRNIKKKKKASSANKRKISSEEVDKFAKTSASHSHGTAVSPPAIPLALYECVKKAADIMENPQWPHVRSLEVELEVTEYVIGVTHRFFGFFMPTDWKYERKNARSLIAGYDKVIIKDGIEYMV